MAPCLLAGVLSAQQIGGPGLDAPRLKGPAPFTRGDAGSAAAAADHGRRAPAPELSGPAAAHPSRDRGLRPRPQRQQVPVLPLAEVHRTEPGADDQHHALPGPRRQLSGRRGSAPLRLPRLPRAADHRAASGREPLHGRGRAQSRPSGGSAEMADTIVTRVFGHTRHPRLAAPGVLAGPYPEPCLPDARRLSCRRVLLGRVQYGAGGDQHRAVLHLLPRDENQRFRGAEGHDPLHQPFGRAGHVPGLPRAAQVDRTRSPARCKPPRKCGGTSSARSTHARSSWPCASTWPSANGSA